VFLKVLATIVVAGAALGQTSGGLEQAKRAFDAGRYAEAERLFESAHAQRNGCEVSLYIGLARYRMREMEAALVAFAEAAKCNPQLTLAHIALGDAYTDKGNDGEALAAYERALALEPANASALRGAAFVYTRTKADAKAAAVLEKYLKIEPRDAQAHADLGAAYFATGNQQGAELEFRQAMRIDPECASALLGESNLLLRLGEEGQAIDLLQRVVTLQPNAFEPRFVLGAAYNRQSRFKEAVEQLEAAARLGGDEPEIYYHLARAYGQLGRTGDRQAALAKFATLTRLAKSDTESRKEAQKYVEEAKGLVQSGDLPAALDRMRKARDLRPQDDSILFRLASLDYDLGNYDEARDAMETAIAFAPTEWIYRLLLGLVEGRSGHLDIARKSLETAIRLNPQAADAQNALGEVALRLKDTRTAEQCFRKAAELAPDNASYRANLENIRGAAVR